MRLKVVDALDFRALFNFIILKELDVVIFLVFGEVVVCHCFMNIAI